jgi:hypothetical protein
MMRRLKRKLSREARSFGSLPFGAFSIGALLLGLGLALAGCQADKETARETAPSKPVYFKVAGGPLPGDQFIIELTDPDKIETARTLITESNALRLHVGGTLVKEPASYNKPWRFHLDPSSIYFFEMATGVCDATPTYVEAHLDEAGGAFLPNLNWCPWTSKVVAEVKPPTP